MSCNQGNTMINLTIYNTIDSIYLPKFEQIISMFV